MWSATKCFCNIAFIFSLESLHQSPIHLLFFLAAPSPGHSTPRPERKTAIHGKGSRTTSQLRCIRADNPCACSAPYERTGSRLHPCITPVPCRLSLEQLPDPSPDRCNPRRVSARCPR